MAKRRRVMKTTLPVDMGYSIEDFPAELIHKIGENVDENADLRSLALTSSYMRNALGRVLKRRKEEWLDEQPCGKASYLIMNGGKSAAISKNELLELIYVDPDLAAGRPVLGIQTVVRGGDYSLTYEVQHPVTMNGISLYPSTLVDDFNPWMEGRVIMPFANNGETQSFNSLTVEFDNKQAASRFCARQTYNICHGINSAFPNAMLVGETHVALYPSRYYDEDEDEDENEDIDGYEIFAGTLEESFSSLLDIQTSDENTRFRGLTDENFNQIINKVVDILDIDLHSKGYRTFAHTILLGRHMNETKKFIPVFLPSNSKNVNSKSSLITILEMFAKIMMNDLNFVLKLGAPIHHNVYPLTARSLFDHWTQYKEENMDDSDSDW